VVAVTEGGHDRNKRLAEVKAAQAKAARRRRVPIVIGVVVAIAALAGVGVAVGSHGGGSDKHGDGKLTTFPTPAPTDTGTEGITPEGGMILAGLTDAAGGDDVNDVKCEAEEKVEYHIHTHLAVFVNGAERPVPAGIGIVPPKIQNTPDGPFAGGGARCFYWLHTHTIDGIIHVESPTEAVYTLGQFFALWGQSIDATQIAGEKGAQTIFVDGQPYTGNPADIPLKSREAIQIDVGQAVPFQNVDWSKSQL
jgi:hypothetical protein